MSTTSAPTVEEATTKVRRRFNPIRLFYLAAALVLLALTLAGFQQFYLYGKAVGGRRISPRILP